jgi:uncharacterized protein (DUF1697 family)
MATYVGFLRAINLGANRKFPKEAIVRATEAAGFTDVATYINTGNVRFDTPLRSRAKIEAALEEAYRAEAGFEVPTIVFTTKELKSVAEEAAGFGHDGRHYVSLLKEPPSAAAIRAMEEAGNVDEVARVGGRAVHLLYTGDSRYGSDARLTNAEVEKLLGVATNRNLTVISALAEKWC